MSFWSTFIVLIGVVGSLLTIYGFISSLIRSSPKRPRQLAFLFGAVMLAFVLVSVIFANVLSPQLGTSPGIAPTQSITTPQSGTGHTPTPTQAVPTATPSPTPSPTATSAPTSDYSAAQPGPGCDTGRGRWTPQGLNQIQCGTTISSDYNSLGYLYFQLPNIATFSSNNKISVMGSNLSYVTGSVCLGLAEQGTSSGVLGEFCGNGGWFIYSLSSTGVITQMLNKGITSQRRNEEISLTLQGNTVVFSIDTETYKAPFSSIQPVKVAITNFSYITPAS